MSESRMPETRLSYHLDRCGRGSFRLIASEANPSGAPEWLPIEVGVLSKCAEGWEWVHTSGDHGTCKTLGAAVAGLIAFHIDGQETEKT